MSSARAPTPTVAIVGRPNVGKSTLFNRLIGRRQAIVHNRPGVTRDRITGLARLGGEERSVQLVDTGGLVPGHDPLGLNEQVFMAVEESDLLLLVVDGKEGLVSADERIVGELRRFGKPALLVVNKSDTRAAREGEVEFHRLGIAPQLLVSAEHGSGCGDLAEAILELLPAAAPSEDTGLPRLAIVGRPNVGKSSILNRLVGQRRSLVANEPGTTRDPVDSVVEADGTSYLLIDTAGIRRRSKLVDTPEEMAVMMARRQVERADLAILVVEAPLGVTTGDLAIAGTIHELGRAALVLVNKWDLLDDDARHWLEEGWPRIDQVLASPRRLNISAETGRGLDKLFELAAATLEDFHARLGTSELNRIFERAVARHPPPSVGKQAWKLYYATQVRTGPPSFLLFANRTLPRNSTYRRYLENALRQEISLPGVPIRLAIRKRT